MKVTGIIAEYNSLHEGHQYHIRKSRNIVRADATIAVISSNFVQRGEPALVDKGVRAEMALACGVDLVLELPVVYSSHNAGLFANAAVDILASTGLVSSLCFGMETPDERKLNAVADLLNEEPKEFRADLRRYLKGGCSFVQARSLALEERIPGCLSFLKRPNNNLALAYTKRIREKGYPLEVIPIERVGAGFHDRKVGEASSYASASALRRLFEAGREELVYARMPEKAASLLRSSSESGHVALSKERYWRAIRLSILRDGVEGLSRVAEMREGLENRMHSLVWESESFDAFLSACTSRRYPAGRLSRHCVHLLIGLLHEASRDFQKNGPPYIRVLGANEIGRRLLRTMRDSAKLPLISKSSAPWSSYARRMMAFEHRATEIWEMLTDSPRPKRESRFRTVILHDSA